MNPVTIEFFTDFICPWCYIGKERMTKVVEGLKKDIDITLVPKPYQLYPEIPIGGIDKKVMANKTKPGMGRSLRAEATTENLELNYKKIDRIPNSRKAHQLISSLAHNEDKWNVSLEIIRSYFQDGQDIEDEDYLNTIVPTGQNHYTDAHYETILEEELAFAQELFISLVPTIRLNETIVIPGLHPVEIWTKYIRRAAVM